MFTVMKLFLDSHSNGGLYNNISVASQLSKILEDNNLRFFLAILKQ